MGNTIGPISGIQDDSCWRAVEIALQAGGRTPIQSTDTALSLYSQARQWFNKEAIFRVGEVFFMYEGQRDDRRIEDHKNILDTLIQEGEEICGRVPISGKLIKSENGFTLQDLEASVEVLKTTRLQWHGGMTPQQKEDVLNKVFDVKNS
jgi:hypothetical protein